MSQPSFENSIDPTRVSIDRPLFDQFFKLAIAQPSTRKTTDPIDEHWLEVLNGFILYPSHQCPHNVIIAPNFENFYGWDSDIVSLNSETYWTVQQTLRKLWGEPNFDRESPCLEFDE